MYEEFYIDKETNELVKKTWNDEGFEEIEVSDIEDMDEALSLVGVTEYDSYIYGENDY